MTKLNEQLWAVAKEYARLFGDVIEMIPEYWVSDDPFMCSFGDTMFFTLDEMRQVIDRLPEYIRKHGSREAVGNEIRAWIDWWLDGVHGDVVLERVFPRVTHQLRPNISLSAWLDGCPREGRKPWSGPDADFLRLSEDHDTLSRLISDYGPDRELKVVFADVNERLEREKVEKDKRDMEERQRMLEKFKADELLSGDKIKKEG